MPNLVPYEAPIGSLDDHEELGKAFRVVAKLRNNRLIRAREQLGYMSCAKAAQAIGIAYGTLVAYESLKLSPWGAEGWKPSALKIAAAYAYHPEELWPEAVRAVKERVATLELSQPALTVLPEDGPDRKALREAVRGQLARLTLRQQRVLEAWFGIDDGGEGKTFERIAEEMDVSHTRVGQLAAKAMRILRHPSISGKLKPFIDPDADEVAKKPDRPRMLAKQVFTCLGCARIIDREDAHHPRQVVVQRGAVRAPLWVCDRTERRI